MMIVSEVVFWWMLICTAFLFHQSISKKDKVLALSSLTTFFPSVICLAWLMWGQA